MTGGAERRGRDQSRFSRLRRSAARARCALGHAEAGLSDSVRRPELDDEVHAFSNNRERRIGTYLFGRKMYETMAVWETPEALPPLTPTILEYAPIWQAA